MKTRKQIVNLTLLQPHSETYDQVEGPVQIWAQAQVRAGAKFKVRDEVRDKVDDQVWVQVWAHIRNQVWRDEFI